MKKAIIAMAKDENVYLDEWFTYYHDKLGFNKIYLWDNNDEGDLSLYDVTNKYDYVNVIDSRGRTALRYLGYQKGCYQRTFNQIYMDYDWIGIFDIDEFLYVPTDLDEFLSDKRWDDTSTIHFNWRYYGDNDLVYYDSRPVQERFPIPCPDNVVYNARIDRENTWVKSMIRGKLANTTITIHSASNPKYYCRHANGMIQDGNSDRSPIIDFSNGYIKHYGTKTIEEYVQRKCLYTKLSYTSDYCISASERLNWFFNVNKHTPEKDAIAKFFYDRRL